MTKEISKNLVCVLMRGGVEVWIEKEKLEPLIDLLEKKRFVKVEDRIINTADISGIYPASDLEDMKRRKNGEWQCKWGHWHNRGEVCAHADLERFEQAKKEKR